MSERRKPGNNERIPRSTEGKSGNKGGRRHGITGEGIPGQIRERKAVPNSAELSGLGLRGVTEVFSRRRAPKSENNGNASCSGR